MSMEPRWFLSAGVCFSALFETGFDLADAIIIYSVVIGRVIRVGNVRRVVRVGVSFVPSAVRVA